VTGDLTWLERDDVLQIHDEQIELYGGLPGIRDSGALDSTLARPKNVLAYQSPDLFELAASYAFGLARSHCFVDGNKRTAFASSAVFLLDHGFLLAPDSDKHVHIFEELASGNITEDALAEWFRETAVEISL
jgi:death-on-curing protein